MHAFGLKQEDHLRWTRDCSRVNWEEFVCCQVRANETYSEGKCQFSDRHRDVLKNVQSPHKWWSTLMSAVFGLSSSLPSLVGGGGGLLCESVGKAHLLSDHFDESSPGSLLICHSLRLRDLIPLPSGRVRSGISLDLDPYGGTNQLCMFLLFLKRTADVLAPPSYCSVSAGCSSG